MKRAFVLILTALYMLGCEGKASRMSIEEVKSKINQGLRPGKTDCEQIERFLEQTGWGGSYGRFTKRYQITIPLDENGFKAISVYLYVDENCIFTRFEVKETYTMP